MIRYAFRMRLRREGYAGYKHHHDHIWPDLVEEIKDAGAGQITIFRHELGLFLYSTARDSSTWEKLRHSDVHIRWGELMGEFLEKDESGEIIIGDLEEIFHLEPEQPDKASLIRQAFTMRLKPGALAEYQRHHDEIWPDLVAEIQRAGVAQITTFRSELDLFLYSRISDGDAWARLWDSEVHRRWGAVMEPLMHLTPEGIVDAGDLEEIFHLE